MLPLNQSNQGLVSRLEGYKQAEKNTATPAENPNQFFSNQAQVAPPSEEKQAEDLTAPGL
jgi:hypothetical protein